jgi:hypothetical protein
MPGAGEWQYRVDDGDWQPAPAPSGDDVLRQYAIRTPVGERVEISGHPLTTNCGIRPYTAAELVGGRSTVHNVGHQEQSLATFCRPSAGDPFAVLDALRPDVVTVLFSNDVRLRDADRFATELARLIDHVSPAADVLLITPFEQRSPRTVSDAVTKAGSTIVTSPTALFLPTDGGVPVRGTNIRRGTHVGSVDAPDRITLTAPATASSRAGNLTIFGRRDASVQAIYRSFTKAVAAAKGCALLDLHGIWTQKAGEDWDAAYAAGFMHDALHPTQAGHDLIAASVLDVLEIS